MQLGFKIKPRGIFATLVMTLIFMSGYRIFFGTVGSPIWIFLYYGKILWSFCFFVLSFTAYAHVCQDTYVRKLQKTIFKIYAFPFSCIFIYSIFLWIVNDASFIYVSKGISSYLFRMIAYMGGTAFVCLFKKDAVKYSIYAGVITFVLGILLGILNNGVNGLLMMVANVHLSGRIYVELHEVAYSLSLFLIFFVCAKPKIFGKRDGLLMFFCVCFSLIAWKRIGLGGVCLVILFNYLVGRWGGAEKRIAMKITGIAGVFFAFVYVSFTTSTYLIDFMDRHGISLMGRDILYSYFRNFCEFKPTFMGQGLGFVRRQFDFTTSAELYNMEKIKALHNDYMKVFIEIGFWGFGLWCYYWLMYIPKKLIKKFGIDVAYMVFLCLLFAFITYTTDNTEGYFGFQMQLSMMVTYIVYMGFSRNDRQKLLLDS